MIDVGKEGVYIDLQVQPNARQPGVRRIHGDRLKVAVAAPANGGRANKATVATIADLLKVPQSAVSLVAGKTTRRKRVYVEGMDSNTARGLIMAALDE